MIFSVAKKLFSFSFSKLEPPIFDIHPFLQDSSSSISDCKQVAKALEKYGCLIIKDPRVNQDQNDKFLDLMERYFYKRSQKYYAGISTQDIYPQKDYRVGTTPQLKQKPLNHVQIKNAYTYQNRALTPNYPSFDSKWRYIWNIYSEGSVEKIYPNIIPNDFPQFQTTMNAWGNHMLNGCYTVAQMSAIGLGFHKSFFTDLMKGSEHKLGPSGSDLIKNNVGAILAGFHYDLNFLTIHGKSRYGGLFAWLRTGQRFHVSIPQGYLFVQAGKQLEYITGGFINCGYHEVIYTLEVQEQKKKALGNGKIPWRVSSTLFSMLGDKVVLKPMGPFATDEAVKKYPQITVADQLTQELKNINLSGSS